ncbi:hypothetical protein RJ639_007911 [Escallonia herrerae]|uniref:RRM domain-containing protein n=1 Tax=Escallonia herrerae TaxID=1293975 RepID=A0AA88VVA2_9ASTE|nr:hypothetical protein RJ639_007911 [Escallonia herrerae]
MGRYRGRSRSRSLSRSYSPPRRSRTPLPPRRRYDDPRDRRPVRDRRRSPAPSGLLIRNISLDARPEDLRVPFERFGPVKDVYLPKNYYTGEPRGFGFVKFRNGEDAAEAKHHLNHTVIGGREIAIVFAAENRKTPQEMRKTGRTSFFTLTISIQAWFKMLYLLVGGILLLILCCGGKWTDRGRRARDYYSPSRSGSISRSPSPREDRAYRSRRKSPSPRKNMSALDKERGSDLRSPSPGNNDGTPRGNDRSPHDEKDLEFDNRSPGAGEGGRSLSRSPSRSPYQSRSRSYRCGAC